MLKRRSILIFLVIPKTSQTIESMRWLTLKFIYFQTEIDFFFKISFSCSIPWILQLLCSLIWILPTHLDFAHSFSKYGAWNEIE
jgi:hypothetical protein